MNIKLHVVTWYSQIVAIILALVILALGFYLGMAYSKSKESTTKKAESSVSESVSELDLLPSVIDIPFSKPLEFSGVIETNDVMADDGLND